jgi:hypothetical protein
MLADDCGRIVSFSIVSDAGGFMVTLGIWFGNMLVEGLEVELFSTFGGVMRHIKNRFLISQIIKKLNRKTKDNIKEIIRK